MKALITGGVALCALSLYAAEPPQRPNTSETVLAVPANAQVQDSPLVRAAKATGRLKKKPTNVITNDTLVKTGGHMGIASKTQNALPPPPPPAMTRSKTERPKQDSAAATKDAAAQKAAAQRANADYHDESIEPRYEDPAMQENVMRQGVQPATVTPQPPKPPTL